MQALGTPAEEETAVVAHAAKRGGSNSRSAAAKRAAHVEAEAAAERGESMANGDDRGPGVNGFDRQPKPHGLEGSSTYDARHFGR